MTVAEGFVTSGKLLAETRKQNKLAKQKWAEAEAALQKLQVDLNEAKKSIGEFKNWLGGAS